MSKRVNDGENDYHNARYRRRQGIAAAPSHPVIPYGLTPGRVR